MRVLLIGGGGREHALAWKLKKDDPQLELFAAPGNPGISELASTTFPIQATDVPALLGLALQQRIDLTIVGPEAPLALGITDAFSGAQLQIFGPSSAAARIESSKRFAKELMLNAGIPTARATWHSDPTSAKSACHALGAPLVIKATGLAAGKGVIICESMAEAYDAVDSMLLHRVYGVAGDEILVEEFMEGEELSVFAITDGYDFITMLPAQDHKRLLAGDRGPNTGGMGAYAPISVATPELLQEVASSIMAPALAALREHRSPFTGLLYCGLMLTADGPRVVEFNCRFGDPETQAILPLMESDLLQYMLQATESRGLRGAPAPVFLDKAAVTTVLAAPGYPDAPETGGPISVPEFAAGTLLFHAGTRRAPDGTLVSAGGRVFAVTAVADTLEQAQRESARAAESIHLPGRQFRSDIGWRELKRHAGAS